MDYNGRASQQFRSQSQTSRGTGQGRPKQDDSDAFMRLSDLEIAGCISDIGVPFSREDLLKPQPQQIQKVFEWFAELLMNITRETVEPAMRAAAEDVCKEYMDIIPSDTRNLMGFYASLKKLLVECGINDFSFSDLLRPTHDRLVRIFSYIINFVRFRETQTATIDEHFNKIETTKSRIDTLYIENQDMEARLNEMRRERKMMESQAKEKMKRNEELKAKLLELTKGQAKVAERMEKAKSEKERLTGVLEEKTEKCIAVRQESEKLRPYAQQSSTALQANLTELSENLARDKGLTETLEKRTRALQTSADTFGVVSADVASCVKILEEVSTELQKEDEENVDAAKRRDALSERGNNVREVERTEALLQRQLARWMERTETLRKGSGEKADAAKKRMEELRGVHRKLTEERGDKGREMERRRVRIEQTEKKMADLKENIETEIRDAHDEYLKMDAHIKLYITEMEQAI
ncbi:kinetochore-associated Ndc80 complex subunit nuf2 [Xylographa carneopallida]|nr:kinetochore-associated Ndc80 complex subunit nuf2 [Xylographa carneopallida]